MKAMNFLKRVLDTVQPSSRYETMWLDDGKWRESADGKTAKCIVRRYRGKDQFEVTVRLLPTGVAGVIEERSK